MSFEEILYNATIKVLSDPIVYAEVTYCIENNIPFEFEVINKED